MPELEQGHNGVWYCCAGPDTDAGIERKQQLGWLDGHSWLHPMPPSAVSAGNRAAFHVICRAAANGVPESLACRQLAARGRQRLLKRQGWVCPFGIGNVVNNVYASQIATGSNLKPVPCMQEGRGSRLGAKSGPAAAAALSVGSSA